MSNLLWFFLSEETLPLAIVLIGLGLITGLVPRRVAFGALGSLLAFALLSPFISMFLDLLPFWLLVPLMLFFAMSFLRALLSAGLGARAADHTVGILAADVIRFAFRMLFLPVRVAFGVVRALVGGRVA